MVTVTDMNEWDRFVANARFRYQLMEWERQHAFARQKRLLAVASRNAGLSTKIVDAFRRDDLVGVAFIGNADEYEIFFAPRFLFARAFPVVENLQLDVGDPLGSVPGWVMVGDQDGASLVPIGGGQTTGLGGRA